MQKEKMMRDSKAIKVAVLLVFLCNSSARMRTRAKGTVSQAKSFLGQEILLVGEEEE